MARTGFSSLHSSLKLKCAANEMSIASTRVLSRVPPVRLSQVNPFFSRRDVRLDDVSSSILFFWHKRTGLSFE